MVIPLADENPTRRTPWVTWLLVITNVVVFVGFTPWWAGTCQQLAFYQRWAAVPAELVQGDALSVDEMDPRLQEACAVPAVEDKSVTASVVWAMFLHGGWMHLLANMLYLGIFGNNVEDRLGHLGYAGFYLLTGAIATLAFVIANPNSTQTLVGASGAIAGVLGAYLVIFPRARVTVSVPFLFFLIMRLPAAVVLVLWFVLQLSELRVGELAGGGVAYLAHVGGFVAGAALAWLFGFRPQPALPRRRRPRRKRRYG